MSGSPSTDVSQRFAGIETTAPNHTDWKFDVADRSRHSGGGRFYGMAKIAPPSRVGSGPPSSVAATRRFIFRFFAVRGPSPAEPYSIRLQGPFATDTVGRFVCDL